MIGIAIGDTRRVTQLKQVRRPYRAGIIDEWEFKVLYICMDDIQAVALCESTAWNLLGSSSTVSTKLQTYLWSNMGDSDIWGG